MCYFPRANLSSLCQISIYFSAGLSKALSVVLILEPLFPCSNLDDAENDIFQPTSPSVRLSHDGDP